MSRRTQLLVVAFVVLALGAPLRAATAQTSPDIPGGIKPPVGGTSLKPTAGTVQRPSSFAFAGAFSFETIGAQWLGMWVGGRTRMAQFEAVRRWVLR